MKRFVVFPIFAAVLLSGCSSAIHPTITVTPQTGGSFVIAGNGFTPNTNPCVSLSYIVNVPGSSPVSINPIEPGTPAPKSLEHPLGIPVAQNPAVPCALGLWVQGQVSESWGFSYAYWVPSTAGCTAGNTSVLVTPADFKTGTIGPAVQVSIVCQAALCPPTFTVATAGTLPMYFGGGSDLATPRIGPGPTNWSSSQTTSTCFSQVTYALDPNALPIASPIGFVNGVEQNGQFALCSYVIVKPPPGSNCAPFQSAQMVYWQFTCPNSGGCSTGNR